MYCHERYVPVWILIAWFTQEYFINQQKGVGAVKSKEYLHEYELIIIPAKYVFKVFVLFFVSIDQVCSSTLKLSSHE